MSASPNLQLPYLDANQNQKTVTHNQALRMLDALVNLGVQSSALQAPPAAPADGQRWIVASGATGAWAGRDLAVAAWQDGAWAFYAPGPGVLAYDLAQATLVYWTGTAWRGIAGLLALLGIRALGIGTAPDLGNPLSATLNSALLNALAGGAGGTGDVRLKLNKAAPGNTASLLFQDGFSGRAEIGLSGDDRLHLKVSADGATYTEALVLGAAGASFAAAPTHPSPPAGDASTSSATTSWVAGQGFVTYAYAGQTYATAANATLTGTPTAPTPAPRDNSTKLATTAYADRGDAAAIARTQVGDAAYAVLPTDRTVAVAALSAPRVLTLPAASAYPQGATLTLVDESGACSAVNVLTVARTGSDTVNGAAGAAIASPFGYLALQSNGANKWTLVDQAIAPPVLATVAQGAAGAQVQFGVLEQLVTLSGAATASAIQIPGRAIVFGVSSRTVAAVTGAPSYGVGVAGNPTQFGGSLGAAAGSTNSGVIGPTAFYGPTSLLVSATSGSFTGGAVRVAIHYALFGAPTA